MTSFDVKDTKDKKRHLLKFVALICVIMLTVIWKEAELIAVIKSSLSN